MSELNICRICLRSEAKGYKFEHFQLKYFYEEVIAVKVNDNDGLPQWFCFECATLLHKFHKFKEKCYIGQKCLKELLWKGPLFKNLHQFIIQPMMENTLHQWLGFLAVEIKITYEAVYKIDRKAKQLQSTLQTIAITERIKTFTAKETSVEETIPKDLNYNKKDSKIKIEDLNDDSMNPAHSSICDSSNNVTQNNGINILSDEPFSPVTIIVDKCNIVKIESKDMNTAKSKNLETSISLKEFSNKYLSEDNWKKVILTEDEAVKEFREKAEDPKYLDAAYKCRDCFKGFSKKDMLSRHVQSRHSVELGTHECRFCRMRFKWNCHLRKHIQQHFTKYECLRCHIVFHLDTSALLHEEYHSGTTKKCAYCNEEFRHMTTYYTHMRTHRSAHVCVRCGASFVSGAGLTQHRRRKHAGDLSDSPESDDDELIDTYCGRCDIRFDTRRAYEEHLFHSDMHAEVIMKEEQDDITPTKKILGKRLRAKITKELRKRKSDIDTSIPIKGKRRKRIKRKHRKPSTCHQCGKHFETQVACMKHHLAEHPRTSFFAPTERHICELCGASLAPGSVAVHQNMHSREKVHTCETCGRQFHSGVGLKRHLVTHTGEKPFACPLCDKRFTQSNSMKLHYNTFHLKQPYPKRTRKKKKDQPNQSTEQEDTYEEESDSLPEQETESAIPEVPPSVPDVPPTMAEVPPVVSIVSDVRVVGLNGGRIEDENMHYLTLT